MAVETGSKRDYPLPRLDDDPRFTTGLAIDVARVLARHHYPKITEGRDFLKLKEALFAFLYEPLAASGREVESP
jgi:hypothetical protein